VPKHIAILGTNFQQSAVETAEKRLEYRPKTLNRQTSHLKLHVVDNTFDFHALHANISPRTRCQKISPLFVAFVSRTLNLDPKTRHNRYSIRIPKLTHRQCHCRGRLVVVSRSTEWRTPLTFARASFRNAGAEEWSPGVCACPRGVCEPAPRVSERGRVSSHSSWSPTRVTGHLETPSVLPRDKS
jgi:hypothetical protein